MKLIQHYRNLPTLHINTLWDDVQKDGVKAEKIREILLFYMHHRTCLPSLNKTYDILFVALTGKLPSKKMKLMLVQCVEEMCHWLFPQRMLDLVTLESNTATTIELLNCFLINRKFTLPTDEDYVRLIRVFSSDKTSLEDSCKVLTFLTATCSGKVVELLTQEMVTCLRYAVEEVNYDQVFTNSPPRNVDGTRYANTAKVTMNTMTSKLTDKSIKAIVTFSQLRTFLSRPGIGPLLSPHFLNAIVDHCAILADQYCQNSRNKMHEKFHSSTIQEVVHILAKVVKLNSSLLESCEKLLDKIHYFVFQTKDIITGVAIWNFVTQFGLTKMFPPCLFLDDYLSANFAQGNYSYVLMQTILDHIEEFAPSLCQYFPNLLKVIATHPSSLLGEFMEIILHLNDERVCIELFHALLDLPVLSATICIKQTPALRQVGAKDTVLTCLYEIVNKQHKDVYSYFMRSSAFPAQLENVYSQFDKYFSTLKPLVKYGLVETTSQLAPLLINCYLCSASKYEHICKKLIPVIISRTSLIYEVPGYQKEINKLLVTNLRLFLVNFPNLVNEPCILKFISAASNSISYPLMYTQLISLVGTCSQKQEMVSEHFDAVECCLFEILTEKQNHPLELLNVMTNTLSKLSSRHPHLIPRALNALEKVTTQVQASDVDKEIIMQHNKELTCLLCNPYIANTILTPSNKHDQSTVSLMRVLTQLSQV